MIVDPESFLRDFLNRQRELSRRSLQAVSDMASANTALILESGANELEARKLKLATIREAIDGHGA